MGLLGRRAAKKGAVPTRPVHPAWDPDRPLPTPSNEWVDQKISPVQFISNQGSQ